MLDADEDLDPRIRSLVLAARSGEEALEAAIAGDPPPVPSDTAASTEAKAAVHVSSIEVGGFRGIGPSSSLLLTPGPGLTLVIGRNGSGKSSFAEGLEILMTGTNLRWESRASVWRDGWRNLHAGEAPKVAAELAVEGRPDVVQVSRSWTADADLPESSTAITDPTGTWPSLDATGWAASLDAFRPFLSYNELGSMLEEKPSDLYDAMAAFLGLDDLVFAQKLLAEARLARQRPAKAAKASAKDVIAKLDEADDPRATEAATLMRARKPDLAALRALAASGSGSDDELERLRIIRSISTPDVGQLAEIAETLEAAISAVTASAGTAAGQAERLERLLTLATEHAEEDDDETCPVCGTEAVLTGEWRTRTIADIQALTAEAAAATEATNALDAARKAARTAIVQPATALASPDATAAQTAVAQAWEAWAETPDTEVQLAARLRSFSEVEALVQAARDEAAQLIEERDLSWRPHARAISNWLDETQAADVETQKANEVKLAEDWLKGAIATIRDERFSPIADRSRELWDILRHRSNVALEAVDLEGTNTSRRVELKVTVDGEDGAALGVMSQGELHALALSLFLPRATMDESPFRFVMIDDPVQAMDPARVDGLARVLEKIAQTHQVIVFTHDDRLPESVRRLQIPAEVTEVTRQPGSKVSTRPVQDPVSTALDDARAVAYTSEMSPAAIAKVVPFYCRLALEAAASGAARRRMLKAGRPHREAEDAIAKISNLRKLTAMAVFGDADRADEVNDYLKDRANPRAPWVLHWCNAGAHGEVLDGSPKDLVRATEQVARYLETQG